MSQELGKIVKDFELNQSEILKPYGLANNTFYRWASQGAMPETIAPIVENLIKKSRILRSVSADTEEMMSAIEACSLRLAWIAKRLGISRQALWENYKRGLSDARAHEIQKVLHEVGKEIYNRARKIKRGEVH